MAMSRLLRTHNIEFLQTTQLNILLLGKTGNGKSATGNSILLDRKAFKTSNDSTSCTSGVESSSRDYTNRRGKSFHIKVIDGPGLQDTELSKAQDKRRASENIARVLKDCDSGIHAFILVIRLGVRFTQEDRDTVTYLKRVLGERFLHSYGVIVVTHGDEFDDDSDSDDEEPTTFKDWCHQQRGYLQDLFAECKYRCVLFNNKTKDQKIQTQQLETLLQNIEEILQNNKGRSYTTELFQHFSTDYKNLSENRAEDGYVVQSLLPPMVIDYNVPRHRNNCQII